MQVSAFVSIYKDLEEIQCATVKAAAVEGWDALADAEAAASESGGEASSDDGAECRGRFGLLAERLALGRGQQDIRRYLRPAGAPPEDEADQAELPDGLFALAEATSHAEDEAAAVAMGLSLGLAEEVEEVPCDRGDLEEDWGDHGPRERALFEAEEAAAESLGLPLGLEAGAKPVVPPPGP